MEQLSYEKKVEQQRLRAEISQAKRQAEFFAQQVEKGAKIRRLEEKVISKDLIFTSPKFLGPKERWTLGSIPETSKATVCDKRISEEEISPS